MEVEVLIQSDDAPARVVRLAATGPMTVGRSPQATLYLEGDLVSRTHAVLEVREGGVLVEDRSSNGTMVGEEVVHRNAVWAAFGTPIVVGPFALSLHPADSAAAPPVGALPPPPPPVRAPFLQRNGPSAIPPAPPIPASRGLASNPPPALPETRPMRSVPPPPPTGGPVRAVVAGPPPPATRQAPPPPPTGHAVVPMPSPAQAMPMQAGPPHPGPMHPGPVQAGAAPERAGAISRETEVALRREIHARLLENLDLAKLDAQKMDDPSMRPRVLTALRRIVQRLESRIPPEVDRDQLIGDLADEALGLGPLERFISDPTVTEIMVVDPSTIYVEKAGRLSRADARFTDDERVRAVIERIVTPLGRRIDESSPLVDARLKDGSRVNAVIRPLALRGSCITIRKFARTPLGLDDLVRFGALTAQMARFLVRSVVAKRNVVISGGTGSGKTTLLNVLSGAIPDDERIVTIEDAAELQLKQNHVVSLETRPANMEGRGEYTIRDLVKNALRMRPDRIVVGECRGGEALDMLQAMNTGHDGSLTTTHANSPDEAVARLETLVLMGGVELPSRAIREQIAGSVHLVVQQSRFSDGTRRVSAITEVTGIEPDGTVGLRPIFEFVRTGTGPGGKVVGEHRATGYLPSYLDVFIVSGLVRPGEPYL